MLEKKGCPKCNAIQIEKGIIGGNGVVHIFSKNSPKKSSPISAYFCLNFGYILGL
ncbi:acetyltransferase [Bacillus cereus]|uniref:acetyltransferase n=1 Tax=Bacillus cereus TaxID=1396 RepID=UPI000B03879A|nr:acetyltransferase [Bacillus cereus]